MEVLVTGSAGFIGYHLVKRLLLQESMQITGIDNLNDYYDVQLKYDRLSDSGIDPGNLTNADPQTSVENPRYEFIKLDLIDSESLMNLFRRKNFDIVINLAAQAGVRYSLINPQAYIDSNITGFFNLLECCRHYTVKHLIYASSSSVYGLNQEIPFKIRDKVDQPISLYAASKKSNELMAHAYSHLFSFQTTGLRFFTVYGPWGRPDMALYKFTKAIVDGKPIEVFNNGRMRRDFTYIKDIIDGIEKVISTTNVSSRNVDSRDMYRIFNIGRGEPVSLMDFINELEKNIGIASVREYMPLQDGDVSDTWADLADTELELGYKPTISVAEGVKAFVDWYLHYYGLTDYNDFNVSVADAAITKI